MLQDVVLVLFSFRELRMVGGIFFLKMSTKQIISEPLLCFCSWNIFEPLTGQVRIYTPKSLDDRCSKTHTSSHTSQVVGHANSYIKYLQVSTSLIFTAMVVCIFLCVPMGMQRTYPSCETDNVHFSSLTVPQAYKQLTSSILLECNS